MWRKAIILTEKRLIFMQSRIISKTFTEQRPFSTTTNGDQYWFLRVNKGFDKE